MPIELEISRGGAAEVFPHLEANGVPVSASPLTTKESRFGRAASMIFRPGEVPDVREHLNEEKSKECDKGYTVWMSLCDITPDAAEMLMQRHLHSLSVSLQRRLPLRQVSY